MGQADLAAAVSHLLHQRKQLLNGLALAPAFMHRLERPAVAGFADNAETEKTGRLGDDRADAAVFGKIVEALKGKDKVGMPAVRPDPVADRLERRFALDQLLIPLHQQLQLRPGGKGIQDEHLGVRPLLKIFPGGDGGRIVAPRQPARQRGAQHHIAVAERIQPILNAGAGGSGRPLVGL